MSLERVLRNTSANLSATFEVDGVATDPSPDTATVEITRADGTTLVAETAATPAGVGKFTYTLTPTQTALLDILTVRWQATLNGAEQTITSTVEVVGGFLFNLAQIRANPYGLNATDYPNDLVIEARTLAEQRIEDACGVAFVPRYRRETLSGLGGTVLLVGAPRLRSIRSATVDGTALTSTELAEVTYSAAGTAYWSNKWLEGANNIVVAYEHGFDSVPGPVSRAALILAKHYLTETPLSDRTTSFSNEDGTFTLATPGLRGSVTGLPEVDAIIAEYGGYTAAVA